MSPQELFKDLITVPGLRNVLLFKKNGQPVINDVHEDFSLSDHQKEQVLRGLKQVIDQLDEDSFRLELRGEYGRFIIRSIGADMSIACVTGENLNVPLLEIALEQCQRFAEENQDEIIAVFRDEETTGSHAKNIPSAIASYSSVRSLRSYASIKEELEPTVTGTMETVGDDFKTHGAGFSSYQDLSDSLCEVSKVAVKFLGKSVVANYLRQTQPEILKNIFEISLDGTIKATRNKENLSTDELMAGANWMASFIRRCEKIIIDTPLPRLS